MNGSQNEDCVTRVPHTLICCVFSLFYFGLQIIKTNGFWFEVKIIPNRSDVPRKYFTNNEYRKTTILSSDIQWSLQNNDNVSSLRILIFFCFFFVSKIVMEVTTTRVVKHDVRITSTFIYLLGQQCTIYTIFTSVLFYCSDALYGKTN